MTRRRRLLIILLLLLVVGVPLIAAGILGGYVSSGGIQNELSAGWTSYGMPGRLTVQKISFTALDQVVAEGISLGEEGQPVLATAEKATIRYDLIDRRLVSLRIEGAKGGLDEARYQLLLRIIRAEQQHPPTRAPAPVVVDVAGQLTLPGGVRADDVQVHVEALGAEATVTATGAIAGRPLRLAISTSRVRPDAPVVTVVEVKQGAIDARQALEAVCGIGLLPPVPPEALPFLPGVVDATGTVVTSDVVADTFTGPLRGTWEGGGASGTLDADPRRVAFERVEVRDARLGSGAGRIEILRTGRAVMVDASAWKAGPGLPLPSQLPMADIATLLPGLQVRWPVGPGRTSIALVGASQARLEVLLGGGLPPRVQANELPLVLVQSLVPPPLVIGGGNAVSLTASLADGRPDVAVEVRQARFLASGWAFGPVDGRIAAVVAPDGGIQVSADLPKLGSIAFAGTATEGSLNVTCSAVEGLLARLRGPVVLPDLSGSLALQSRFHVAPAGTTVVIRRLELGGAEIHLKGRELVKSLDAVLKGTATVSAAAIAVDLGGQLKSGRLLLPGSWLDVAERTPIFSIDLVARLREGRLEELQLRNAIVRAADPKGEPQPGGFSAQFAGSLKGENLVGSVDGVVDHADLHWIVDRLSLSEIQVGGEGAVAASAVFDSGEVKRIDGAFLPLGADLDIGLGKLKVGGITGAVKFTLDGRPRR